MRARALAGGVIAAAAIVSVGWQIGAQQLAATSASSSGSGASSAGSGTTAPSSPSPSPSASSGSSTSGSSTSGGTSSSKSSVSGTFVGTTAQTQFGPMQVEIVVADGEITDVKALQLTDQGGRSVEISDYAAPILRTEALSAQSASIQSVSGATYTSEGYITSLQAAIDKAGL